MGPSSRGKIVIVAVRVEATLLTRAIVASDAPVIPITAAPAAQNPSQWDLLMKLDAWQAPGLSVAEFRRLFKSCTCGLVMTERVFESHVCAWILGENEIGMLVDLTVDESKA
ncbi:hypothetical protein BJ138DRAFT_1020404 [Hygrophoropsis aurantiaca]|uniref:Uncharacterized protein n=1 Tax=Hygrophoropsis aurantiaca TaxID=72124 RepID=A0ACB7ZS47_9AGAM|nr:hypothetical protein BJ138DRAFT_1020404 [Hygrophoropsis aurantiaca]